MTSTKSLGEAFAASPHARPVTKGQSGQEVHLDVDLKALFSTTTGWTPDTRRDPGAVPFATRPLSLLDLIPTTSTGSDPVTFMEETTFTNNAAEAAEGALYGEAALAYTEKTSKAAKVSVWLPVTDEALEDVDDLAQLIDQRLSFMIRQRLEAQILVGNGTAPNLRGILNVAGIQTQAKGVDSTATALRKAITKVQTPGEAVPDLQVLHPTDAEELDLAGATDPVTPYVAGSGIWQTPKVVTAGITLGTGLVGDFTNFCALRIKRGITLKVSNSHGTFFAEGKQAIRADIRAAFIVYRPAAFVSVTGI